MDPSRSYHHVANHITDCLENLEVDEPLKDLRRAKDLQRFLDPSRYTRRHSSIKIRAIKKLLQRGGTAPREALRDAQAEAKTVRGRVVWDGDKGCLSLANVFGV